MTAARLLSGSILVLLAQACGGVAAQNDQEADPAATAASAPPKPEPPVANGTQAHPLPAPARMVGAPVSTVLPHQALQRATSPRPSAIRAESADAPRRAALAHLRALTDAPESARSVAALRLRSQHGSPKRPRILRFEQEKNGIPILHSRVAVLMTPKLDLLAVAGSARSFPEPSHDFVWKSAEAAASALGQQLGCTVVSSDLQEEGADVTGHQRFGWQQASASNCQPRSGSASAIRSELLRARAVFVPTGETLLPGYELDVMTGDGPELQAFHWVVSAVDGKVLERTDLVFRAHRYRVWASDTGLQEPWDVPHETLSPHPTGQPDGFVPKFLESKLITVDGRNTNPDGGHDPWLPDDATTTAGNHVVVFGNLDGESGFSANADVGAMVSSDGVFDSTFDFGLDPLANQTQVNAALVQMFYTINWLHDWYYDSGFNEAVGNAQVDNFGRGGADQDPMIGEAMSGAKSGARDDALMVPLPDGVSPVMRMFLWHGPPTTSLVLAPGGPTDHSYATFGPQTFNVSAQAAVAMNPETGSSDACSPPLNNLTGRVALVERGNCTFVTKTKNAQAAGAVAVLVANDVDGRPAAMSGTDASISIPTLGISLTDGTALKQSLLTGAVSTTLAMQPGLARAGSMDSSIVAHEWGHYLNVRLVGPPSTAQSQAMGEGWGDFVALHMDLGPDDDPSRAYPIGGFATAGISPDLYFGVRRVPYSTSFDIDPLTFRHIQDGEPAPANVPFVQLGSPNSEIHNAGEIWATMLHEAYAAVIAATHARGGTFESARRAMSDYVVAGLLLQTDQSTFTGARDALITAAAASKPADASAIAAAFARRGAGTCARSPAPDSEDFVGLTESFSLAPQVAVEELEVVPSPQCSVDDDDLLDVGEKGTVRISLKNVGFAPTGSFDLRLDTAVTGSLATFPEGVSATISPLAEAGVTTIEFPIVLRETVTGPTALPLRVLFEVPEACEPSSQFDQTFWVHADTQPGNVADFQVSASGFEPQGELAELVWEQTVADSPLVRHFSGRDLPRVTDTALVSPTLEISPDEPFTLSFTHHYEFETDQDGNWDGGVVEVSMDGGTTWTDASELTEAGGGPAYPGSVQAGATQGLAGRAAYVDTSAGYPSDETTTLQFGTALAGEAVRVRFRIATDGIGGTEGWSLSEVRVSGVTNSPFEALIADTAEACVPQPPVNDQVGTGASSGSGGSGQVAGSGATGSTASADPGATGGGPTLPADPVPVEPVEPETPGGCSCALPGSTPRPSRQAGWLLGLALATSGGLRRRGRYQPKRDFPC